MKELAKIEKEKWKLDTHKQKDVAKMHKKGDKFQRKGERKIKRMKYIVIENLD